MSSNKIRPAMVAGMFYPQKKITLEREVAIVLENAPDEDLKAKIVAVIAPHAGYMYSGGVAARAYRQIIDREYHIVVVISPSHREYFKEISIYEGYGYSTPLGVIPIDQTTAKKLTTCHSKIVLSEKGHRFDEHSLEVQLPFLQKVLDNFKLIPVVMGEQDMENINILADALANVLKDQKALIVASSDLSHFYNYDKATILDKVVLENVNNFDADKLFNDVQDGRCEMCGAGPVVAAMKASKMLGANKSKVLLYRNSGDITGDRNEVVGYMSAILYS
jgi:AmmeMemoRadiSam system protein B